MFVSDILYCININFCLHQRILASTSGDNTIRLWSMQSQTNAVVIRVAAPIWQVLYTFHYRNVLIDQSIVGGGHTS